MQTLSINHQPSRLKYELTNKFKSRKTKTMIMKFLRKFFWMGKPNNRHSIHHLSDHLKRDMGFIEADLNNKPRPNDRHSSKYELGNLWL